MNQSVALDVPRTESRSIRLSVWDYFFRALSPLSLLLFVALAWDLLAHPDAPQFSTPASPVWFHALFGFVILPLWWLVSTLILWRAPGNLVGRFLLLMMIGALGWQFSFGIGTPEFGSLAFELFLFYWGTIGFPSLVLLLMVFPDGKLFPPRWLKWAFLFVAIKVLGTILELMSVQPGRPIFTALITINPFFVPAIGPYQPVVSASIGAAGSFIIIGLSMGIASLLLRYRVASMQVRQQIKWLLWWAVVFVLLMPFYYAVVFGIQVGNARISLLIPLLLYLNLGALLIVTIGIAIFRYHLFDIDLILNRTLVYGTFTAFVVFLYILSVGAFGALFQTSGNLLISLLATGVIAFLFQPLRERLQRGVNRLIYGERDDPYAVLSKLGARLEATLAPEAVLPTIVEAVARALKLPYVAIDLEDEGPTLQVHFPTTVRQAPARVIRLPLTYQNEPLGELLVAPRVGEEKFSDADVRLLKTLADQASIAAHSVQLTTALQHSRERLVTAREEERRRIRRDLHDGLGPALASLTLKLDAANNLVEPDPAAAKALLGELKLQAQVALSDIRRLVYDLRPPALDELGLASALREHIGSYNPSHGLDTAIEASEPLPPLPAAIEVAAYRIVLEAHTNAVRHAHARHCRIRLWVDEALHMEIIDDGVGLANDFRAGVGLTSMRERAAEVGGACFIKSCEKGGTQVRARLPLPPLA